MTSVTPKGLKVHDDRVYDPKKKKHSQSAGRIRSTIRWLLHEWKHKGFRQVQTTDFTSRTRRPDEDFGRKHLKESSQLWKRKSSDR